MKRLIAALLAGLTLFALVGCSAGSKADSAAPKDYSQILHDARTDEENEYDMIFTKGEDGKFTAIDGYSAEYEAGQLDDEVRNLMMPLLNLEDDMYTDLAASVSSMMVRSYAVAIVKPAEGKTDAVKSALEAYVTSEQQSMEHYLEDQYQGRHRHRGPHRRSDPGVRREPRHPAGQHRKGTGRINSLPFYRTPSGVRFLFARSCAILFR